MNKVVILLLQFVCSQCSLFYQVTHVAAERSAVKRLDYMNRIGKYDAEQLVFVDESSVDCRTTYHG